MVALRRQCFLPHFIVSFLSLVFPSSFFECFLLIFFHKKVPFLFFRVSFLFFYKNVPSYFFTKSFLPIFSVFISYFLIKASFLFFSVLPSSFFEYFLLCLVFLSENTQKMRKERLKKTGKKLFNIK